MRHVYSSGLVLLVASITAATWASGCAGTATTKSVGGGASLQPISVKLNGSISAIRAADAAVALSAVVTNDPANRGVHWDLQVGLRDCSPSCGALRSIKPFSVEYVPPAVVPGSPSNKPTITATAMSDNRISDGLTFTIAGGPEVGVHITKTVDTIPTGGTAVTFQADLDSDLYGDGVTWKILSGGGGSKLIKNTPTSVQFVAPPGTRAPANNTVTLAATSVLDPSRSANTTFKLVDQPSKNAFNGKYAFELTGFDAGGKPMAIIGAFQADGSGTVSGTSVSGNDNLNAFSFPTSARVSYSIDSDSRGLIMFPARLLSEVDKGLSWAYTLKPDGSSGRLMAFDTSGFLLSGSLERQTTPPGNFSLRNMIGGFAFELASNLPTRYSEVGQITISCGNAGCTQFSAAVVADVSVAGSGAQVTRASFPATITNPNATRGVGTLTIGTAPGQKSFIYVIISSERILLMQKDAAADVPNNDTLLAGVAARQRAPFFDSVVNGTGVFGLAGLDTAASPRPGPVVSIGRLTITDQRNGLVLVDSNNSGRVFTPAGAVGANVTFDSATGRGTLSVANGSANGFLDSAVFYLADSGMGFILDTTPGAGNHGLVGGMLPQIGAGSFSASTLSGGLVASVDGFPSAIPTVDASIAAADGKFAGIADFTTPVTQGLVNAPNQVWSGGYSTVDANTGRGIATIPGTAFGQTDPVSSVFYIVGPRQFALIGAAQNVPSGVFAFDPLVREPDQVSIAITPATVPPLDPNGTQPFSAIVTCRACDRTVAWTVVEPGGGTVTPTGLSNGVSTGLYRAPTNAGTYHVMATSTADPTKTATATVTVRIKVTVSPANVTNHPWNATRQFSATVTGTTNRAVTWSVDEGPAGGSITSAGLYTAPNSVGIFHVRATSVFDSTVSAIGTINVVPSNVTIFPPRAVLPFGGTQRFRANRAVTWSITEGPSGGTIDAAGNYSAPQTAGVFHVKATSAGQATLATITVGEVLPRFAYVANSDDSTVSTYWENPSTGQLRHLGYVSDGGTTPVALALATAPGGPFLYVANQGSNNISALAVDPSSGALTSVAGSPFATGTQPQSVAVTPSQQFILVANTGTSNVSVFSLNSTTGALTEVAGSPFPAGRNPQSVIVTPSGQFVLVANAADGTVSVFAIDGAGMLTPVTGSPFATGMQQPQAIAISPNGALVFVANQGSSNVSVFSMNSTGTLTQVTGSPFAAGAAPVALTTDRTGKYLYVVNRGSNNVSAFSINGGALAAIYGSPLAVGTLPRSLAVDAANAYLFVGSEDSRDVTSMVIDPDTGVLSIADSTRARGQAFSIVSLGGTDVANATPTLAYATNSVSNDVSAYTIAADTGALTEVSGSPFATGAVGPRAVAVDPMSRFLFTANNASNSVAAFTIDPATGVLGTVAGSPFPAGTGPQALTTEVSGQFLYEASATSGDIYSFTVDPSGGTLTPVGLPVAAGVNPSGVTTDPAGRFLYVTNRGTNNISAFVINSVSGALTPVLGSPFAAGTAPVSVAVDRSGKFLFVANHDSSNVSAYTISGTTGALTPVAGSPFVAGMNPTAVSTSPSAQFVYVTNEASSNVTAYLINAGTGKLTQLSGSPFVTGTNPQSVAADISGQYLYVVNQISNNVWAYTIDPITGAISQVPGSPFAAGTNPVGVATTGTVH